MLVRNVLLKINVEKVKSKGKKADKGLVKMSPIKLMWTTREEKESEGLFYII